MLFPAAAGPYACRVVRHSAGAPGRRALHKKKPPLKREARVCRPYGDPHLLLSVGADLCVGPGGAPRSSRPTAKGVYCTTQGQDKPVEASVPEIEESGSHNAPAPLRRLPAPAATTQVPGVRPP